jgi:hypothetical protein
MEGNETDVKVRLDWQVPVGAIATIKDWVDLMNTMFNTLANDGYHDNNGKTYKMKNVRVTKLLGPGESPWSVDTEHWLSFHLYAVADLDGELQYA